MMYHLLDDELTQLYQSYDALLSLPSPPAAPYQSAYAARDVLLSLVGRLAAAACPPLPHLDLLAQCHVRLGQNCVDTEETQLGEAHLLTALPWLAGRCGLPASAASGFPCSAAAQQPSLQPSLALLQQHQPAQHSAPALPALLPLAASAMDCCSHLALLHSGWDNHARALRLLRLSKAVHRQASAAAAAAVAALEAHAPEELQATLGPQLAALEGKLTHACFYLTQVYGHLGCRTLAVHYIERLLCRQVLAGEQQQQQQPLPTEQPAQEAGAAAAAHTTADRLEWARNALRLGTFHMAQAPTPHWEAAHQCYSAAECMLARLQVELGGLQQPAQPAAAASEAEGEEGSAGSSAPLEASALLATPAPSPQQAAQYLSQAASGAQAEALARLRAEADMHWGQYYERVLSCAAERDAKGGEGSGSSSSSAGGSGEGGQGSSGEAAAVAAGGGSTSSGDPFSTLPEVTFRRGGAGGEQGPMRGTGVDLVSVDDSDHEMPVEAQRTLPTASSASASASSSPTASGKGSGRSSSSSSGQWQGLLLPLARRALGVPFGSAAPSAPSRPPLTPASIAHSTDWEGARAAFLAAQSAFTAALRHFVLDGYVSEHRAGVCGLADCWRALSRYEPAARRRASMWQRRAALLGGLAAALSPAVYRQAVGELGFEAGVAWVEAMDAAGGVEGGGGARLAEEAAGQAVAALGLYLRGFEDARWTAGQPLGLEGAPLPSFPGAGPVEGEGEEEGFAMAHFLCTRALFRRRGGSAAQACLRRCTWFLGTLLPGLSPGVASRLGSWVEVTRQLCELLPQKIAAGLK